MKCTFLWCNPLSLYSYAREHPTTLEEQQSECTDPPPCHLHHTHSFNFPVCVMILVYACGAFPGQEGEEAVDEDNYRESYHPQNHMVFSPTSIYSAAYLRVTPGRMSCTLADGNAFPNVVVKCNYSQTPWGRGNQNFWLHKTKEVHSKVYATVVWWISSFNGWQYSC